MLGLPIDQRYGADDMDAIASAVGDFVNREARV